MTYLPFDLVVHMFFTYINEGFKILFRMGYGFFKIFKKEINEANNYEELHVSLLESGKNFTLLKKKLF